MKCSICGRRLRKPESKELGYGPVCYKRKFGVTPHTWGKVADRSASEASDCDLPGQISIDDYLQTLLRK